MKYDSEIKLKQTFNLVLKEYENYKNNLLGKSILVIYRDRTTMKLDYVIVKFDGSNYYHLTGLAYKEDDGDSSKDVKWGSRFYQELEDKKLSISTLKIKDENTALKMKALPFLTSQYKYTNMTGDFNGSGIKLEIDKVMGNVSTCLGLKRIIYKTYAPASSLYEDVRKYAKIAHQVVAVFLKDSNDTNPFSVIKYVAKGNNLNNLTYSDELKNMISLENYIEPKKNGSK